MDDFAFVAEVARRVDRVIPLKHVTMRRFDVGLCIEMASREMDLYPVKRVFIDRDVGVTVLDMVSLLESMGSAVGEEVS